MSTTTIYEDGTYLARNPTWHEEDSPWKAEKIRAILDKNLIVPSSICEVGCGSGSILDCLADGYGTAVLFSGYEISPQAFAMCKDKVRQNVRFYLTDPLKEEESVFDVALAIDVIEHVEDCYAFLRALRTKGKYKVFHIPLDVSVQSVLRNSPILANRRRVGHIHYFTKDTALATLEDTGYVIIDFVYTNISIDSSRHSWRNRFMKIPRKLVFAIHKDMAVRLLGGFSLLVLAK